MVSRGSGLLVLTGNLEGRVFSRVVPESSEQRRDRRDGLQELFLSATILQGLCARRDLSHEPDAGTEGTISAIHCA